jgi:hypothetical protein
MVKKEALENEIKNEVSEQDNTTKQENSFTSGSDEIRYYVKQKLGMQEECAKQELIDYVRANAKEPKALTENMFTNTFRVLVESGELLQMARGVYRKGGSGSMKEKVAGILKKAQQDIAKVCTVNILNMGDQDMDMLPLVQQCLATMNVTENKLYGKIEESRV